ncbi:MAG: zf-HC2 domain-containing protein [Candidatus Aminicenantes bacterium]|nr:MAG: zf-HC2 domain-containing protein [Candidatus Aminicenantes bacterium]
MKCQKIQRLIPLLAGSELPESQISSVKVHLEGCLQCQREYEKYTDLVNQTREWLAEDKVGWKEQEWRETIQSVVNQGSEKKTSLVPWPFPRAWAYALMAGAMLLLATLVIRPPFLKQIGLAPEYRDVTEMEKQEVVSMTMVSKETGLKIVWFFNKNFNLEENE